MTLLQFLLIQVNLIVLYGLYRWMNARVRHLSFNRIYLLVGPALALIAPFLSFPTSGSQTFSVMMPVVEIINETGAQHSDAINWAEFGIALVGLLMIASFTLAILRILIPKKAHFIEKYKGCEVYQLDSEGATTHSIFNRIYVHPSHLEFREIVLEHEYAHCANKHSIDLLLMALYKTTFWYNPIAYLWGKEMQLNHEYLADSHVLSTGIPARHYGETLVALNFTCAPGLLVNAFNQPSSLRKRIKQFNHKNKIQMKHLIILPAVAALTFVTTSLTTPERTEAPVNTITKRLSTEPETLPEYPGGNEAMMAYLMNAISYPKVLLKDKASGKVFVRFVVSETGKIMNVEAIKSSGYPEMDAEAIKVVNGMPDWTPGTKDGKAVDTEMTLPIVFNFN